jgi:hypothetical protein
MEGQKRIAGYGQDGVKSIGEKGMGIFFPFVTHLQNSSSLVFSRELQRWLEPHRRQKATVRATPYSPGPVMKLAGTLTARSPRLRLALAHEIERHCSADEILQGRLIDLLAFVDVDGAPDVPVEAGVE